MRKCAFFWTLLLLSQHSLFSSAQPGTGGLEVMPAVIWMESEPGGNPSGAFTAKNHSGTDLELRFFVSGDSEDEGNSGVYEDLSAFTDLGMGQMLLQAGQEEKIPFSFTLPESIKLGRHRAKIVAVPVPGEEKRVGTNVGIIVQVFVEVKGKEPGTGVPLTPADLNAEKAFREKNGPEGTAAAVLALTGALVLGLLALSFFRGKT